MDEAISYRDAHHQLTLAQLKRYADESARRYEPGDYDVTLFDVKGAHRMRMKIPAATYQAALALSMAMCCKLNANVRVQTDPDLDPLACVIDGSPVPDETYRVVKEQAGLMTFGEFVQKFQRII